ncbi:class I SAM-dependent methyltransferase [Streptomyces sp. NPDC090045]|uniref:class I SAM-dependent methyltransferase n=1 Tax=Streptomyces sp. NPDC090045 TaxID=3365927 RepID=UPI003810FD7F
MTLDLGPRRACLDTVDRSALAAPTEQEVVLVVGPGPGPGVGLDAAACRSAHVIGVGPSGVMLAMVCRRCAPAIARGRLRLSTGELDDSVDLLLSGNNLPLWPDVPAGLTELHRILRPGGRMFLAAHEKWLPTALSALAHMVLAAGFTSVRTWTWQPPTRMAAMLALLSAARTHDPAGGRPIDEPPTRPVLQLDPHVASGCIVGAWKITGLWDASQSWPA